MVLLQGWMAMHGSLCLLDAQVVIARGQHLWTLPCLVPSEYVALAGRLTSYVY